MIKKFNEFMTESSETLDNVNIDDIDIDNNLIQDEIIENEPEEKEDMIELVYNKDLEEWEQKGELETPSDFDEFYDWFNDIDDDVTLKASMKEEDDDITFHLPEDLYLKYLDKNN